MIKNLKIVKTDLEAYRPKKLGLRVFSKNNYWNKSEN